KSQGSSKRKSEGNWETGSTKRDPNRDLADALRKLSRQAEDKLYARLVDMGLPVVEREQLDEVEVERQLRTGGSERDLADRLDATHILVAEIDEPEGPGRFRLSMRLIDVRTGQVLWAANGDETAPKTDGYNKFILNSGRIARVKVPKEAQDAKAKLVENPPLVSIGMAAASAKTPDDLLVIVEDDVASSSGTMYRPLFGNEPFYATAPLDVTPIDTIDAVQRDVKIRDQLMRYVSWKLALECLTPAGRILKVESDGQSVLASLGGAHGVKRGDTLRVMQRTEAPAGASGGGEVLLPVSLKVAEVYENHCRAIVGRSGLGEAWNDDEYRPGSGDLVVSRFDEPRPIAVFPAVIAKPQTPKADRESKWNESPGLRGKSVSAMVSLRDNMNGQLQDSLSKLGVSVFGEKPVYHVDKSTKIPEFDEAATCGTAYDKGARLAIGGIITPVDTTKYQFEIKLIRLQPQPDGAVKLGEVVYSDRAIVTSERGLR
ncbi:MAG: hypothetical protein SH850_22200, partial [Planctomycetaceae bacterium]|nr:hypothetical protein [Planctomycetaceae bacterium]